MARVDYTPKRTLAETNQAVIRCPIFETDTKIAGCLMLRDKVWRGERHPFRQGCQACMRASKCPIVHLLKEMSMTGEDPVHADAPRVVPFPRTVLDRIAPIIVMDGALKGYVLSDRERDLIEKANARSRSSAQADSGARRTAFDQPAPRKTRKAAPVSAPSAEPAIDSADMSTVVNKMVEKEVRS